MASGYLDSWVTSLDGQGKAMAQIGSYLRDMIQQSVDMAQIVVDVVKEILSIISAGWSMASIPIYGRSSWSTRSRTPSSSSTTLAR